MDYEQFAVTTQVQGFPVQRFKVRDRPAMNLDNLIRIYISKRVQRCLRTRSASPEGEADGGQAGQANPYRHSWIHQLS